tara:strand:+ start:25483 stop:25752 length:270 start_codon:yes stop_codon:yes gene_type:complete
MEDKEFENINKDEDLDPDYLRARDEGILEGVYKQLHPVTRAYVERKASAFMKSFTEHLRAMEKVGEDKDAREKMFRKLNINPKDSGGSR